ncbi:MAG: endonuclease Q family protein [Nanobdellota archaeon]
MEVITDLHIHSRYSRGCSKEISIHNLEKGAKLKGIDLLGTGDFSHPQWLKEIKTKLKQDNKGLLRTKTGFPFILQTEFSFIYKDNDYTRRIHLCVLAPSLKIVEKINSEMSKIGRLDYDGRPIFNISCEKFTQIMMRISTEIEIIPAHIWTPWFGLFGSCSGYNSIKDCFGKQIKHIHAVETGLSSDPAMNWRLSQLDGFSIISSSDCHSYWPWRIGREATIFDMDSSYKSLINAIRKEKIISTLEVDPAYGKYFGDGHRNCNVSISINEAIKRSGICPVCKKHLTKGVMHRLEELADRHPEYIDKARPGFKKILPLHEIISCIKGKGLNTKAVWNEYYKILKDKSENYILLKASKEELRKLAGEEMASAIIKNRETKIKINQGFDGIYGKVIIQEENKTTPSKEQEKKISEFF